jgi:hypothetical protein
MGTKYPKNTCRITYLYIFLFDHGSNHGKIKQKRCYFTIQFKMKNIIDINTRTHTHTIYICFIIIKPFWLSLNYGNLDLKF